MPGTRTDEAEGSAVGSLLNTETMQTVTVQTRFSNARKRGGAYANVLPVLSDGAGDGSSSCSKLPVCTVRNEVNDALWDILNQSSPGLLATKILRMEERTYRDKQ